MQVGGRLLRWGGLFSLRTGLAVPHHGSPIYGVYSTGGVRHLHATTSAMAKIPNLNQTTLKAEATFQSVRKRYEEMRLLKKREKEERAEEEEQEVPGTDFLVQLAYKELRDEQALPPGRKTEQFELEQLFKRHQAVQEWKAKSLKGKKLKRGSTSSQRQRHIAAETTNYMIQLAKKARSEDEGL